MQAQVSTAQGKLRGLQKQGHQVYLGIPYARPPVRHLRFRPPVAADPWTGVRNAVSFGNIAPQLPSPLGVKSNEAQSEDCLYLNVYTPAADDKKRPVLFWIHGGAFRQGASSAPLYDGGALCERGDVVIVTVNYRLGALGFAWFGEEGKSWGATANNGLMDQVCALEWVRNNIAGFGGDPGNVTLFGESAGAMSISCLLSMPAADGLYHKAIMQSGAGARVRGKEGAAALGEEFLAELGVSGAGILDVPVEKIIEAQGKVSASLDIMASFTPILDGAVIPAQPVKRIASGCAAGIPVIAGSNRDEMKLFNAIPRPKKIDEGKLIRRLCRMFSCEEPQARELAQVYRASRGEAGLPAENHDIFDAIQSAVVFHQPTVRFAEEQEAHETRVYTYMFTRETTAMGGALGATHGLDIPYVFGNLKNSAMDFFKTSGENAVILSDKMMEAWLAFARTGNPSHAGLEWPAFTRQQRRTMVFDDECGSIEDPFGRERQALEAMAGSFR